MNYGTLEMARSQMVDGLPPIAVLDRVCQACMEGKQHVTNLPKEATFRVMEPLELVHSDICGLMPMTYMGVLGGVHNGSNKALMQ